MRVRHRIPSIFTLSMVDVLCCSLGCVILLWLINLRDAKQHEDDSGAKQRDLTNQVAELEKDRAAVQAEADDRAAALRDMEQKWKDAAGRVVALQADVAVREKDLASARGRSDDLGAPAGRRRPETARRPEGNGPSRSGPGRRGQEADGPASGEGGPGDRPRRPRQGTDAAAALQGKVGRR